MGIFERFGAKRRNNDALTEPKFEKLYIKLNPNKSPTGVQIEDLMDIFVALSDEDNISTQLNELKMNELMERGITLYNNDDYWQRLPETINFKGIKYPKNIIRTRLGQVLMDRS